jgi:tRNA-specific 2-thiouridylase
MNKLADKKEKVILGMSGGVDSSLAAFLLKDQGYDVIGVTLKLLPDEVEQFCAGTEGYRVCCSAEAVDEARVAALKAGIPHYVIDGKEVFQKQIIDSFISEYAAGRTPNPCTTCNRYVKIPLLLEIADDLGAEFVATGHYIYSERVNGIAQIRRGDDPRKEQSYMLCLLDQAKISRLLLPMGNFTKDETRKMAAELEISTASKPDSQDICFVPDGDYRNFLKKNCPDKIMPGSFVSKDGKKYGPHQGHVNYTVGQRRGLGIPAGFPLHVLEIQPTGDVVVGSRHDLLSGEMKVRDWVRQHPSFELPGYYDVQVRYHHVSVKGEVSKLDDGTLIVKFDDPVSAITPGQVVAFYQKDVLLGGGIIV